MSEMQYLTHIRAFFSLPYGRMPAEKKYPTAHKILDFRCEAVLKEKIFVTARRKSEGIRGYCKDFQRSCGGNITFKTIFIAVCKSISQSYRLYQAFLPLTSPVFIA